MINDFCWYLEHKSRRLLYFDQQTGTFKIFLLFEQYGIKIFDNFILGHSNFNCDTTVHTYQRYEKKVWYDFATTDRSWIL